MSAFWLGMLSNMAMVGAIVSVWTHARGILDKAKPVPQSFIFGLTMGIGVVLSMLMNVQIEPGLYVDLRAPLLAVAGLFGGAPAALAASAIGLAYRSAMGGVGVWAGDVSVLLAAAVGIAGHWLSAGRQKHAQDVVMLASATGLVSVASVLVLPQSAWPKMLPYMGGPGMMLILATTLLAGFALLHDERLRALTHANMLYRAIVEMLPDSLNAKGLDGRFVIANRATAQQMRAPSALNLLGHSDFDFYPEETALAFQAVEQSVLADGAPRTIEQQAFFEDGKGVWLATLKAPMRDAQGELVGLVTHNRDITTQKRLQEELGVAHQRLEDAMAHMADGLVLLDKDGVILLCNAQYPRLFPGTADLRKPGARIRDLLRASIAREEESLPEAEDIEAWLTRTCAKILAPGDRTINLAHDRWLAARTRRVNDGGSLILFTDITDRKRADDLLTLANEQMAQLALSDSLTGLTNRRGFDSTLEKEFARGAREGSPLALLLVDVDKFKAYNDAYGHQAGDRCLQLIGAELTKVFRRPADLVARYGGEEFVAVLPNTAPAGASDLAEQFRNAVRNLKIAHSGSPTGVVTVSVGVTSHIPGKDFKRAKELVRSADQALYAAKAAGRDRIHFDQTTPGWTSVFKLSEAS
jgi:diguanylate cyclase (GGDEF)-like protein/PAS domain S-box-containing protein